MPDYSDAQRPPGWSSHPQFSISLSLQPERTFLTAHSRRSGVTYPRVAWSTAVPEDASVAHVLRCQDGLLFACAELQRGLFRFPEEWYRP